MASIWSRISQMFRRPLPKPPTLHGHRGIAAGDLSRPDLESYRQRVASGHHQIPPNEVEAFLTEEYPLFVHSTNVAMLQYFPETGQLMVEYKNGKGYLYSSISPFEAQQFVYAQSKGKTVWDLLRIRGRQNQTRSGRPPTRKPFVGPFVRGILTRRGTVYPE